MQNITGAWITLPSAAGLRMFSKMVSSYVIFSRTGVVFKVLSRKKGGRVPGLPANDLAEVTGRVIKEEEVAANV